MTIFCICPGSASPVAASCSRSASRCGHQGSGVSALRRPRGRAYSRTSLPAAGRHAPCSGRSRPLLAQHRSGTSPHSRSLMEQRCCRQVLERQRGDVTPELGYQQLSAAEFPSLTPSIFWRLTTSSPQSRLRRQNSRSTIGPLAVKPQSGTTDNDENDAIKHIDSFQYR